MAKETHLGIFHKYIHIKLQQRLKNLDDTMERKKVIRVLGNYNIPNELSDKFLKEMQGFGLLKQINQKKIQILKLQQKR